jgi:hypothetical protein
MAIRKPFLIVAILSSSLVQLSSGSASSAIGSLRAVNNAQGFFMSSDDQAPFGCLDSLVAYGQFEEDCEVETDEPNHTVLLVRNEPSEPSEHMVCYPLEIESHVEFPEGFTAFLEGAGRVCFSKSRLGNVVEAVFVCTAQFRDTGEREICFVEDLLGFLEPDTNGTNYIDPDGHLIVSNIGSSGADG